MIDDKAIDEIRAIRHHISEECGHDTQRLLEYMQEQEKDFQEQILKYQKIESGYSISKPQSRDKAA